MFLLSCCTTRFFLSFMFVFVIVWIPKILYDVLQLWTTHQLLLVLPKNTIVWYVLSCFSWSCACLAFLCFAIQWHSTHVLLCNIVVTDGVWWLQCSMIHIIVIGMMVPCCVHANLINNIYVLSVLFNMYTVGIWW